MKAFKSFIFFPSQKLLHGLKWVKLPLGWSKLNTDGFALQNSGLLGGGGFSKIQMGCGFVGFSRAIRITTRLDVELWALWDGLAMVRT